MGSRFIGLSSAESPYGNPSGINFWIDVISESITESQENIHVETAGARGRRYSVPGPYKVEGSWDQLVAADNISRVLDGLCGTTAAPTPSGDGNATRHVFTPGQTLKSYTMEVCPDVGGLSRRVVGTGIQSVAFEAIAREALSASVDVFGKQPLLITSSSPTATQLGEERPFVFYEGVLSFQGVPMADVEAFRLTYANDIDTDAYVLGSRFLPAIRLQGLTVSGDMDIAFTDWTYYKYFWGNSTATTPQSSLSSAALDLIFTGEPTTSINPGFTRFLFQIELPRIYLDTSEANFDRRERIVQSIEYNAIVDLTAGYVCRFTLINEDAAA